MNDALTLYLICDFPFGCENANKTHMSELASQLEKIGCCVKIIAPKTGGIDGDKINVWRVPVIDLPVIRHATYQLILPLALSTLFLRRKPDVLMASYTQSTLSPGFIAKIFGTPCLLEVGDWLPLNFRLEGKNSLLVKVCEATISLNCRLADHIVTVTEGLKKIISRECGIRPEHISVNPNAVNTNLFKPQGKSDVRERLGFTEDLPIICFTGTFKPQHGLEYLIECFREVKREIPEAILLLVGDGPEFGRTKSMASRLDGGRDIVFTGRVPYDKVPEYINAGDVCVAPLTPAETGYSPLKIYEYCSCGRPVVASRVRGLDFIEETGSGVLVEPLDSKALSDALIRVLKDEPVIEKMGVNAREYALKHGWMVNAEKIKSISRKISGKKIGGN